jgi:hypothetical protein
MRDINVAFGGVHAVRDVTIELYAGPLELFDLAHCVMLVEQGIIPAPAGRAILGALLALLASVAIGHAVVTAVRRRRAKPMVLPMFRSTEA